MITTEIFADRIEMRVWGEFTLLDYKALEELSEYRIRMQGPIDLLLDFSAMTRCTVDVALEQFHYVREHPQDFARVAVITESEWVTWASWLTQFYVEADIRVFHEEIEARNWLGEPAPLPPPQPQAESRVLH